MIRKAFLAHSSKDKAVVREVARDLDRHDAIYDEDSFETGVDFESAITRGLDESVVFVLFASQNSIKAASEWIKLEQKEARERLSSGQIRRALVFIIDDRVSIDDIPEWLKKGRIENQKSPKIIARQIRRHIETLAREDQQPVFLGRGDAIDQAQRQLMPIGRDAYRAMLLFGIRGIGKRTLCKKIAESFYALQSVAEIRIEEGDSLSDIVLKLADAASFIPTPEALRALGEQLAKEETAGLLQRAKEYMQALIAARQMPLFFDEGGMIDNDGVPTEPVNQVRQLATKESRIYLALVTSRRALTADAEANSLPAIRVDPLKEPDIAQLVTFLLGRDNRNIDAGTIHRVAKWVRGYPPAAYYAAELIERDGLGLILEAEQELVSFRSGFFLKALERDRALTPGRRRILRALAEYDVLPVHSIRRVLGGSKETALSEMRYLLDCAFVSPDDDGLYRVSDPLVEAITRVFRDDPVDHKAIRAGLHDYQNAQGGENIPLSVERNLWRASVAIGGPDAASEGYYLASDIIRALQKAFHNKRFDEAIRLGRFAVEMRPESVQARSYLTRALIQDEQYDAAEEEMAELRVRRQLREYYYLKGYLEQRRGRLNESAGAFREALRLGRGDSAVHRELAETYYYLEEYKDAAHHVNIARKKEADNKFLIDLDIRIKTKLGDFAGADAGLRALRILDDSQFYQHRKSVLEYAKGEVQSALNASRLALNGERHPSAEVLVQAVKCEIEAGDINAAQSYIAKLSLMKRKIRQDVVVGLRVKLETAKGNYEDALLLCDSLKEQDRPIHIALRRSALQGFLGQMKNTDPRYPVLNDQLSTLGARLQGVDSRLLDVDIPGSAISQTA